MIDNLHIFQKGEMIQASQINENFELVLAASQARATGGVITSSDVVQQSFHDTTKTIPSVDLLDPGELYQPHISRSMISLTSMGTHIIPANGIVRITGNNSIESSLSYSQHYYTILNARLSLLVLRPLYSYMTKGGPLGVGVELYNVSTNNSSVSSIISQYMIIELDNIFLSSYDRVDTAGAGYVYHHSCNENNNIDGCIAVAAGDHLTFARYLTASGNPVNNHLVFGGVANILNTTHTCSSVTIRYESI